MLKKLNAEDVLFIDVETVPQYELFEDMPERFQKLWEKKAQFLTKEDETPADIYQRAGIYSEFGKIICISAGFIVQKEGERQFRVKSYYGDDEKQVLSEFNNMLTRFMSSPRKRVCGHNALEFDIPYIARRTVINGLELPNILDIAGAKPWEIKDIFLDTMQLWKFGDYKHYTSLDLLCAIFNIPTPKDDIDGSEVAAVYYQENDLDRIARYCEKDVFATAQLLLRYKRKPLIPQENYLVAP
ncbi:3'-5' exonuclease [Prolixibacteraceae bacterium JC049]|nr:3'-5' exonuclease [Prolixibacteraceae bacterium JC049]